MQAFADVCGQSIALVRVEYGRMGGVEYVIKQYSDMVDLSSDCIVHRVHPTPKRKPTKNVTPIVIEENALHALL